MSSNPTQVALGVHSSFVISRTLTKSTIVCSSCRYSSDIHVGNVFPYPLFFISFYVLCLPRFVYSLARHCIVQTAQSHTLLHLCKTLSIVLVKFYSTSDIISFLISFALPLSLKTILISPPINCDKAHTRDYKRCLAG